MVVVSCRGARVDWLYIRVPGDARQQQAIKLLILQHYSGLCDLFKYYAASGAMDDSSAGSFNINKCVRWGVCGRGWWWWWWWRRRLWCRSGGVYGGR